MQTAIYKGKRQFDTYLYVETEADFKRVPEALIDMLGTLEHVMTIELSADRSLASADVAVVMQELSEKGYFLQLPPKDSVLSKNKLVNYRQPVTDTSTEG